MDRPYAGRPPLRNAVQTNQLEVAKILLRKGTDRGEVDRGPGDAVEKGNVAIASVLLDHGANPNARGSSGRPFLQVAIQAGYRTMAELLKRNGADPKVVSGPTPPTRGDRAKASGRNVFQRLNDMMRH